ncbi:MAG TPA: hypothetical protein O0X39_04160 [Methanocorpusculum sp.]|nr:hypothetical protein [Methanocorpusculum sp.]
MHENKVNVVFRSDLEFCKKEFPVLHDRIMKNVEQHNLAINETS